MSGLAIVGPACTQDDEDDEDHKGTSGAFQIISKVQVMKRMMIMIMMMMMMMLLMMMMMKKKMMMMMMMLMMMMMMITVSATVVLMVKMICVILSSVKFAVKTHAEYQDVVYLYVPIIPGCSAISRMGKTKGCMSHHGHCQQYLILMYLQRCLGRLWARRMLHDECLLMNAEVQTQSKFYCRNLGQMIRFEMYNLVQ